ncbi:hypothetical protein AAG570_005698 [Ranatra chinensis]|uniref:Chitin-binding type-2 domain-containing protein n=1 Tax=Ranatra chinensis TaxID=642074 RepID=A0ABD0YD61_9HEMI
MQLHLFRCKCAVSGVFMALDGGSAEYLSGTVDWHRVLSSPNIPVTSFTCEGRPVGYYADVEAKCQVYHMCGDGGRQFSYLCPDTTLFQQRMLVCAHWYQVNCSRSHEYYRANLLIGQKDTPFVGDEPINSGISLYSNLCY